MVKNENEFSATFKEKLKLAGLTQKKFAEKYGIPYTTITSYAQGYRVPAEWVQKMMFDVLDRDARERGVK